MAFKDLVRQQRQQGSGILSSVGSAVAGSARESLDIRNALFSSGSFLNTLFPKVKGFKAGNNVGKGKSPSLLSSSGSDLSSSKLDQIGENTKIAAKNSFVLPAMARDMNVMRQNIIKLVKMSGGKPSTKSDMFFLKAAERESAYESAMAKSKGSMTTRVGSGTQSKTGETGSSMVSILSSILLGGFKTIKGMLSGLLSTFDIFKGIMGSIASSAIFKLFTGGIGTLLKSVFAAIGSPLVLGIIAGFLPLLYTMFKAKQILDAPAVKDELRETQKESNRISQVEAKNIKIGDKTAEKLMEEEQNLYLLSKSKKITDSEKKQSAARRKALESVGFFALEVDDPSRPGKKELFFRREFNQDNIGGLDLPSDTSTPTPSSSNKPTPQQIERAVATPDSTSPIRTNREDTTKGLLDIIAKGESGAAGYNAMNQGGNEKTGILGSGHSEKIIGKKLTEMTVGEVQQRGKLPMRHEDRIFAAGRYQIIPETLNGLVKQGIVSLSDKFDEATQDKLGAALIHQSGALEMAEQGNLIEAQNRLSKIWAAIPDATTGTTALSGPNKASATIGNLVQTQLSGSSLNAGSVQVADGRMAAASSGQSVVVNAPQTNMQAPQGGQRSSGNVPSVVDTDFMRHLVAQLVT